jgi:hypothetical protein
VSVNQIEISHGDIEFGVPGEPRSCIIALAANRALGSTSCEYFDETAGWFLRNGNDWYYVEGGEALAMAFDNNKLVEPTILAITPTASPYAKVYNDDY